MARRTKQLCFAVIFASACILLVWYGLRSSQSREIRLKDGRILVIHQASYGTEHELAYGKPWFRMLAAVTPNRWRQKLPLRLFHVSYPGSDKLVIWGEWTVHGTNRPAQWLILHDQKWKRSIRVYGDPYRISSNRLVMSWTLDNFPRRARTLTLELADSSSPTERPLTTFEIRNPIHRGLSRWDVERFPATRTTNQIDLVLANLCQATFISSPWLTMFPKSELTTGFAGVFQVRENGRVASNWSVDRMTVRDASGNRVNSRPISASISVGGYLLAGVEGPLWSTESDWKVTGEFVRTSNFSSNELCNLKGIPIPTAGSVTQELATAQANGISIIGVELTWRGRGFNPLLMSQDLEIEPLLPRVEKDDFISLVEVRDDAGRSLRFEKSRYGIDPFHFGIELPGGSKSLDLTFALQKRLTAEWTVGLQP